MIDLKMRKLRHAYSNCEKEETLLIKKKKWEKEIQMLFEMWLESSHYKKYLMDDDFYNYVYRLQSSECALETMNDIKSEKKQVGKKK